MARHELTDREWEAIHALLPSEKRPGRPWRNHRQVINGMLWVLATGAPWRDLPKRYGPWQTVYDRFARWRQDGTIQRIMTGVRENLDEEGLIDWDLWCIDGASVRAGRAAAGGGKRGAAKSRMITRLAIRVAASDRSFRIEVPPAHRQQRHPAKRGALGRSVPRVQVLGTGPGRGQDLQANHRAAATATESACWRQGIQRHSDPQLAEKAPDSARDPHSIRRTP
jgi:transposase